MLALWLMSGALLAANIGFVGHWKLDPSRTRLTDVMKVEHVSGDTYAFDFGGGSEKVAVDGKDHQAVGGTTLSVGIDAPDSWTVVRKKDGRILITAKWRLSKDSNTLTDDFTVVAPNGSGSTVNYVYKRTAEGSGFAGTWESSSVTTNDSAFSLKIEPYEDDGLAIIDSSQQLTKNVKFDGRDYPNAAPNLPAGVTFSALRVDEHTLEITDKFKDKAVDTENIQLSADGKTLTITVRPLGRREPNVLVFERQ